MERVFERLRRKKDTKMDTSTSNRRPPLSHLNASSQAAGKKRRSKRDSMFSFISNRSSDEKDRMRQQVSETEVGRGEESAPRGSPLPLDNVVMVGALPTPRTPIPDQEEIEQDIETEAESEVPETHRIVDEIDMSAQDMPPSPTTTTAPSNLYLQANLQDSSASFSSTTSTLREEPLSPLPLLAPRNQAPSQSRHHSNHESFVTRTPQDRHSMAGTGMSTFALQERLQEREQRIADAWLKAEERRRRSVAWPHDPWRGGFGPPAHAPLALAMPSSGREFVGYGYFGMSGVGVGNGGVGPGFGGRPVPFTGAGYGNSDAGGNRNRHSMVSTRSTTSGAGNGGVGVGALRGGVREWLGRRTSVREGV